MLISYAYVTSSTVLYQGGDTTFLWWLANVMDEQHPPAQEVQDQVLWQKWPHIISVPPNCCHSREVTDAVKAGQCQSISCSISSATAHW
jgi:hypothetical protein